MRDRYEPPSDPQPWPAFGPAHPVRGAGDPGTGYDWDPDYLARPDGPADETRDQGLRRLSMLTLHATGLSVVTAIGFATVFATAAHAQSGTAVTAKPSPGPVTATGTPSPGPTPTHHKKKKHHHKAHPAAAPAAAPGASAAAAPAAPPPPTLAPPANAPAPAPPSPAPTQATSSGSVPA
jgi:hypothetical protein